MIGIYKFTNKINNHSYIGQSINIEKRYEAHLTAYKNPNHHCYNNTFYIALRKYGINNFNFEILEECNKEELNNREKYWIKYYDTYNNGYNMTEGGDSSPSQTPEVIAKIKNTLLNNEEVNKKLSHKGEDNANSKLTLKDVKNIRIAYQEGKTFGEVYPLYQEKISRSGFQYCWLGKSWKEVMPEVFQQRTAQLNGGSSRKRQEIYQLRLDYMNGLTNQELQLKYNMSYQNVRRILKLERWLYPETIPQGYENFISK